MLNKMRALEPENWVIRLNIVGSLIFSDRLTEAKAELEQWPDDKLETLIRASKYAVLQQLEVWRGVASKHLTFGWRRSAERRADGRTGFWRSLVMLTFR